MLLVVVMPVIVMLLGIMLLVMLGLLLGLLVLLGMILVLIMPGGNNGTGETKMDMLVYNVHLPTPITLLGWELDTLLNQLQRRKQPALIPIPQNALINLAFLLIEILGPSKRCSSYSILAFLDVLYIRQDNIGWPGKLRRFPDALGCKKPAFIFMAGWMAKG